MSTIRLKCLVICSFILALTSCSSSDDAETPIFYGETTGNYFPMAQNNIWHYDDGTMTSAVTLGDPTTFANTTYYFMTDTSAEIDITVQVAKRGATYLERANDAIIPFDNGTYMTMKSYEVVILRDDLQVGQTWGGSPDMDIKLHGVGNNPQNIPATLEYEGTILARDQTEVIGLETFTNVIKVRVEINQMTNGQPSTIDGEYWFSKDVGMIKSEVTTSLDNQTKTKYLYDYTLN